MTAFDIPRSRIIVCIILSYDLCGQNSNGALSLECSTVRSIPQDLEAGQPIAAQSTAMSLNPIYLSHFLRTPGIFFFNLNEEPSVPSRHARNVDAQSATLEAFRRNRKQGSFPMCLK